MAAPSPTVCAPWCEVTDLTSPCRENIYNYDADVIDDALLTASEVLYHLTFQQWPGECDDRVRPCARYMSRDTIATHGYTVEQYTTREGSASVLGWIDGCFACSCERQHQCGCHCVSQIELGQYPIASVDLVRIDGEIIDAERYRVDDYRWLVYLPDQTGADDRTGWPCCQRMDLPTTEVDTFEVEFTVGSGPSRAGVRSAAALACQFMLAWTPGAAGECKLPKRVTSLSRQQVAMNISDPLALFDKGLTGIAEVDLWVQAIRSERSSRQGAVVIPERQRSKARRTDT